MKQTDVLFLAALGCYLIYRHTLTPFWEYMAIAAAIIGLIKIFKGDE